MLPTLAERLREQQARTRSRPPARQPWPLPIEPPTALLFQPQPQPQAADPVAVAPHEPVAPMAPQTQTRTAQAEVLLLVVWAVLVVIDGALALASLIDRLASRGREGSGVHHRKRVALAAPSSAAVSDSSRGPGCQRVAAEMPLVATPM